MSDKRDRQTSEKIHQALMLLKEASDEKRVAFQQLVSEALENVKEAKDDVVDKAKESAAKVDRSVHDKPWYYIGGAALGGLILGFIFRSRRK